MDIFPELPYEGGRVDPVQLVEPGTGFALVKGSIIAALIGLALVAVTYGVGLLLAIIYPLIAWYQHRKALALIHGSGIKLSTDQFPQIYKVVEKYSERLGIEVPDIYLVESNVLNAYAVRHGKRNVVLLTDNMVNACLVADKPNAMCFIIGHELAHIALRHNTTIRTFITTKYKALARLNEYSADRVAAALVQTRDDALAGLIILTIGPRLAKFLNGNALNEQIREVTSNTYSKKAEKTLTHPLLLNRIQRLQPA